MVRGSAKAFDHNQLIHDIWSLALESGIAIWIERVPSKYNVADSPSRHEWKILDDLGKTQFYLHVHAYSLLSLGAWWIEPIIPCVDMLPA